MSKTSNIYQPLAISFSDFLVGVINFYLVLYTVQVELRIRFIRNAPPRTIAPKAVHPCYLCWFRLVHVHVHHHKIYEDFNGLHPTRSSDYVPT